MQIQAYSIQLDNGHFIHLKLKIIDAIRFNDFVVVLADPIEKLKPNNENVFGYNINGELLWQIEDLNLFHESHYYTSIYIQDQEFYLYNKCGVEVKINPTTGTVLSTELIK